MSTSLANTKPAKAATEAKSAATSVIPRMDTAAEWQERHPDWPAADCERLAAKTRASNARNDAQWAKFAEAMASISPQMAAAAAEACAGNASFDIFAEQLISRADAAADADAEAWNAALDAYHVADRNYAEASLAANTAEELTEQAVPLPAILRLWNGNQLRTAQSIEKSDLPFAKKVEAMGALEAFQRAHATAAIEYRCNELDEQADEIDTCQRWPAAQKVMSMQPPTVQGLAAQARVWLNEYFCTLKGEGPDDPATISRLLSSLDAGERMAATMYQRTLVLAGVDSPVLGATAFDAAEWIADFVKRHPGCEFDRVHGDLNYYDCRFSRTQGSSALPLPAREELRALPDWKRKRVRDLNRNSTYHSLSRILGDIRTCVEGYERFGKDADREWRFAQAVEGHELTKHEAEIVRADLDKFGWTETEKNETHRKLASEAA